MAGISITEKRIAELKEMQAQLNELSNSIQKIIDGKMSMSKFSQTLGMEPQTLNNIINKGTSTLIRKHKIINNSNITKLLIDSMSPGEKLIKVILKSDELVILKIAEEDQIIKIMEEALSEKEYDIIKQRFGFGCEVKTLHQLGKEYGVTHSAITDIQNRALTKLRNAKYMKRFLPDYSLRIKELDETEFMIELNQKITNQIESAKKGKVNYNTPVDDLNVSARAKSCLLRGGIETIGQLSKCKISRLMRIRNLGYKTLEEINNALVKHYGIILGDDEDIIDGNQNLNNPKAALLEYDINNDTSINVLIDNLTRTTIIKLHDIDVHTIAKLLSLGRSGLIRLGIDSTAIYLLNTAFKDRYSVELNSY